MSEYFGWKLCRLLKFVFKADAAPLFYAGQLTDFVVAVLTTGAYDAVAPYRQWYGVVYSPGKKVTLDDFRRDSTTITATGVSLSLESKQ